MTNKKKSLEARTMAVSITMPMWLINEIDNTCGSSGRSSTIAKYVFEGLIKARDAEALKIRIGRIDEEARALDEERERLSKTLSNICKDTKRLDDPEVIKAVNIIAERAKNYLQKEGLPMLDKGIRTMAERQLQGPMPTGFIEKIRKMEK